MIYGIRSRVNNPHFVFRLSKFVLFVKESYFSSF